MDNQPRSKPTEPSPGHPGRARRPRASAEAEGPGQKQGRPLTLRQEQLRAEGPSPLPPGSLNDCPQGWGWGWGSWSGPEGQLTRPQRPGGPRLLATEPRCAITKAPHPSQVTTTELRSWAGGHRDGLPATNTASKLTLPRHSSCSGRLARAAAGARTGGRGGRGRAAPACLPVPEKDPPCASCSASSEAKGGDTHSFIHSEGSRTTGRPERPFGDTAWSLSPSRCLPAAPGSSRALWLLLLGPAPPST